MARVTDRDSSASRPHAISAFDRRDCRLMADRHVGRPDWLICALRAAPGIGIQQGVFGAGERRRNRPEIVALVAGRNWLTGGWRLRRRAWRPKRTGEPPRRPIRDRGDSYVRATAPATCRPRTGPPRWARAARVQVIRMHRPMRGSLRALPAAGLLAAGLAVGPAAPAAA